MTGDGDTAWVEALQREASDPRASVWVTASAGSGKTKVLTDRVLRLLLAGASPERILCLTFTRAAAAEMATRIADRLSRWAMADDSTLAAELRHLLDRELLAEEPERARRLFATVLDAPGQLNVQTIHGFCGSVLRRFPLEAGLPPQFQVLDERTARELLQQARDQVIRTADDSLDRTLTELGQHLNQDTLVRLQEDLLSERARLAAARAEYGGADGLERAVHATLGTDPGGTPDDILRDAAASGPAEPGMLHTIGRLLLEVSAAQKRRGRVLLDWLAADTDGRVALFEAYRTVFLTADGGIRARLLPVAIQQEIADSLQAMTVEADRLLQVEERCRSIRIARRSAALGRVALAILDAYLREKRRRNAVDYEDLVLAARDLLSEPGVAPWVLYKLDGGVDHVLVDEAQDTSPEQWQIIEHLTDEFFADHSRESADDDMARTVFAVGDVKQSIFSFQGADPRQFLDVRERYRQKTGAAGAGWSSVPLDISFRSTPPVLRTVDAVFEDEAAGDGVREPHRDGGLSPLRHTPWRSAQAGRVEWWPPETVPDADRPDGWTLPVHTGETDDPALALAQRISDTIRGWLDSGERLESRDRPIRAGDIMVLLRRRRPFAPVLANALKRRGIDVAGVDRMILAEQLVVRDLIALGQFLLLPWDDLALAAVLKGPLAGVTEDELYALCHDRREPSLWAALNARASHHASWADAREFLRSCLQRAGRLTPYEFYGTVLSEGGRRRLLERLGAEAGDPIDEFLAQALEYERAHVPSLQGFLHWLEAGETEVKRDLETGEVDEVRIMTVHGSKGLQAPIVFLPDTMTTPRRTPDLFWIRGPGTAEVAVWSSASRHDNALLHAERERAKLERDREYRRLLYVGMTRAEDRLYVCGWGKGGSGSTFWNQMVHAGLLRVGAEETDAGLAIGSPQNGAPDRPASPVPDAPAPGDVPDWATARPLRHGAARRVHPSFVREPRSVPSPFEDGGTHRFRRGRLIHSLLQKLPLLPRDQRRAAGEEFLDREAPDMPGRPEMLHQVLAVLDAPGHAALFGPDSLAEVPIVGEIGAGDERTVISGRIDRLVVTAGDVLAVDFKSTSSPPSRPEEVPAPYLRQMACYRWLLRDLYPDRTVSCSLVWTDVPALMELPSALLDAQAL